MIRAAQFYFIAAANRQANEQAAKVCRSDFDHTFWQDFSIQ
jgi:hypothetical protein